MAKRSGIFETLTHVLRHPPEAWMPARMLALRALRPVEQFLHVEAAGGITLIVAAVVALVWANSPWQHSYDVLWHTPFSIGLGDAVFTQDLHFWINEFAMTLFFLVIGLEVKREITEGTLSSARQAALPLAAALGGMVVPAAIYAALNLGGPALHGWGVPMATDIAFAVGVLVIIGNRLPPGLRVLLLALAIVDDIGAILIIAVFYSSGLSADGLWLVGLGLTIMWLYVRLGFRPGVKYLVPTVLVWAGMYQIGIHPTLAGVVVGLMAPVKPWYGRLGFLRVAREAINEFEYLAKEKGVPDEELVGPLRKLSFAAREAVSPVVRLVTSMHGIVSFVIVPLFALANAGVHFSGVDFAEDGAWLIFLGVSGGLLVGKPLGVLGFCWLGAKLNLVDIPRDIGYRGLLVVGTVAGIGFTMAIFIAELAFNTAGHLAIAKTAILGASALAAVGAVILGRVFYSGDEAVGR
ncbi:MAG: Na+/H+ antiporter NhaA [Gemmatimonadetes bacterium]|nr:Na+/H+ antiporter NhaA [Gemmatimonadota bacterium]